MWRRSRLKTISSQYTQDILRIPSTRCYLTRLFIDSLVTLLRFLAHSNFTNATLDHIPWRINFAPGVAIRISVFQDSTGINRSCECNRSDDCEVSMTHQRRTLGSQVNGRLSRKDAKNCSGFSIRVLHSYNKRLDLTLGCLFWDKYSHRKIPQSRSGILEKVPIQYGSTSFIRKQTLLYPCEHIITNNTQTCTQLISTIVSRRALSTKKHFSWQFDNRQDMQRKHWRQSAVPWMSHVFYVASIIEIVHVGRIRWLYEFWSSQVRRSRRPSWAMNNRGRSEANTPFRDSLEYEFTLPQATPLNNSVFLGPQKCCWWLHWKAMDTACSSERAHFLR